MSVCDLSSFSKTNLCLCVCVVSYLCVCVCMYVSFSPYIKKTSINASRREGGREVKEEEVELECV